MGRLIERYAPVLVALAATAGAYVYLLRLSTADINKVFGSFISSAVTITTTLLGFLLTIYTIFQATTTRRKEFLIQLGQLPILNQYLRSAAWALLVAALLLLSLTLIPTETKEFHSYWFWLQIGTIGITAYSLTLSIRFINIFLRLVVSDSDQ